MSDYVELRHLRYFLAVADELHFGRAAEVLDIAQPALSQQIRKLESALGATLFERTSRRVVLTAAGSALLDRARRLLDQAARDLDEVSRIGRGEQGLLDVGFVGSAVPHGAIERIRRFRQRYPLVQTRAHEGFTSTLTAQLLAGDLNVAVLRDPDPDPGLTTSAFAVEPFVVVVPVGHDLAPDRPVRGEELSAEPFVFFPRSAGERAYALNLDAAVGAGFRPVVTHEASTWGTILHLVGAGLGITVAPRSVTVDAPRTVRTLPLAGRPVLSSLLLAHRTGDTRAITENFLRLSRGSAGDE